MKPTLLDMTQSILSSMESDEINSISDSTESLQVVEIIRQTYFDFAALANLPRDRATFQLAPSLSATQPVTMSLPTDVSELEWVKYDVQTAEYPALTFRTIQPLPLEDFLGMVLALNEDDTWVTRYDLVAGSDTLPLMCYNDRAPTYYTTTDDNYVLFDAYDSSIDTTLQKSKTLCFGQKTFPWTQTDGFVLPLDEKQQQLVYNDAKALCFAELKQQQHAKAEQKVRRLMINQQSAKTKIPTRTGHQSAPNYGRKV